MNENETAEKKFKPKRRLTVCLDGTWNNKDSSTNVLAIHNLVKEGEVEPGVEQLRYYDEGVGTGVLDSITGGGFGLGLDQNVREAYNWLVDNYREGDDIFIFGFSRGAYTARSLVGFIGRCGLLRPGAPMTVKQLWEAYGTLQRNRETKGVLSFWERVFGKKDPPFRQITSLKYDWWGESSYDLASPKNLAENLLIESSRRVPIHFLGIYDTVGAMGWEALAIPGLRSRMSQHHNMWVTSIIQNCRHALAIDENRSSFRHTPIHQYLGSGKPYEPKTKKDPEESQSWNAEHSQQEIDYWNSRVTQQWFIGAHSNIGGGYPDNTLAQQALNWMISEAGGKGLKIDLPDLLNAKTKLEHRRDSFAEFASPLWTHILRAKRNYRRIDPPTEIRAGYSRKYVNESVDPGALTLAAETAEYAPPHLFEYAFRQCEKKNPDRQLKLLAERKPEHRWLQTHQYFEPPKNAEEDKKTKGKKEAKAIAARASVIGWGTLAAVGVVAVFMLLQGPSVTLPSFLFLALLAALLILVDWVESKLTFTSAQYPKSSYARAARDAIYWVRAIGVILFFAGLLFFVGSFWRLGWTEYHDHSSARGLLCQAWSALRNWWMVPVFAIGTVLIADLREKQFQVRVAVTSALAVPAVLIVSGIIIAFLGYWAHKSLWHVSGTTWNAALPTAPNASLAGWLLLLQLAFFLLNRGFGWVGKPMKTTGLGSIQPLMWTWSPGQVEDCLKTWREKLACKRHVKNREAIAGNRLNEIVTESIHRDNAGLIPLYTMVLMLGMWIGKSQLGWEWLGGTFLHLECWIWIGIITALTDYLENAIHLFYLEKHSVSGRPEFWRWLIGMGGTAVKTLGFFSALFISFAAFAKASLIVIFGEDQMTWRGAIAGTISLLVLIALLVIVGGILWRKCRGCPRRFRVWRKIRKRQTQTRTES